MFQSLRVFALALLACNYTGAICLLVGCGGSHRSQITPSTSSAQQLCCAPHTDDSYTGDFYTGDFYTGDFYTGDFSNPSTRVSVRQQKLDIELMRSLVGQESLKELRLLSSTRDGTPILSEIAKLEQLESLYLFEVPLVDEELHALANMKRLKSLELSRTGITGVGLRYLRALPLTHLIIHETGLVDDGLEDLQSLTKLESLELLIPGFHLSNLPSFASLTKLTSVSILGGHFGYREYGGLKCLLGAVNIRQLALAGKNINDRSLQAISHLRRLERLEIDRSVVSHEGIQYLADLDQLESIKIEQVERTFEQTLIGLVERLDQQSLQPTRG